MAHCSQASPLLPSPPQGLTPLPCPSLSSPLSFPFLVHSTSRSTDSEPPRTTPPPPVLLFLPFCQLPDTPHLQRFWRFPIWMQHIAHLTPLAWQVAAQPLMTPPMIPPWPSVPPLKQVERTILLVTYNLVLLCSPARVRPPPLPHPPSSSSSHFHPHSM